LKTNGRKIHTDGELISTFLRGSTHSGREVGSKARKEERKMGDIH